MTPAIANPQKDPEFVTSLYKDAEYFVQRYHPVSYTHLDVYKRQVGSTKWH